MPTVLRNGPYRFFYFASDRDEPPHVHVEREIRLPNSGLIPYACKAVGAFHEMNWPVSRTLSINIKYNQQRLGMHTSIIEIEVPTAENILITQDMLSIDLSDGRTISVPLAWYPRLAYASQAEQNNWRLIGKGYGIHWEDLDEDISVEG
jgi:hypothetical protein